MKFKPYVFLKYIILSSTLFIIFCGSNIVSQSTESELKAVFIEKIVSYIKWPNESDVGEELVIGVYKNADFYRVLTRIYKNREISGKRVVIKYLTDVEDVSNVSLVHFSDLSKTELLEVLIKIIDKPILTFGDKKGYSEYGVHVNFYTKNDFIRFELNTESLKRTGFYVNPVLIDLSKK
jgi:hypothetical protein